MTAIHMPATDRAAATPEERAAAGKAARSDAPRSSHADWERAADRPNPVDLLEEQAASRLPELVPLRYGRMSASPFAFFRGAASVMARDLAGSPRSGARVQLCGDAHVSNFGAFASPERNLLFDLNDFDETLPGPWEWDVKRLAASIAIAARGLGLKRGRRRALVREAVGHYRKAMRDFAPMHTLDVWYAHLGERDFERLRPRVGARISKRLDKGMAKARAKDSQRAFNKLTERVDGAVRITPDPPLIQPLEDLLPGAEAKNLEAAIEQVIEGYRESLPRDRRRLLDRYRYVHSARKVVGVGSVGTRAWIILLLGRDDDDPLFLQAKEAQRSVLEPFAGPSEFDNQGERVVEGQRLVQAASDIFLGWLRTTGIDGEERDFYFRQLWDWKGSVDLDTITPTAMAINNRMCAWTLARAHARSGDAIAMAAYLGCGESFDKAIAEFAETYADQNERDHAALLDAIDSGRVEAVSG
jgi:uncharacterized protein (DUF2252 family)